jgi:hypothetical protein
MCELGRARHCRYAGQLRIDGFINSNVKCPLRRTMEYVIKNIGQALDLQMGEPAIPIGILLSELIELTGPLKIVKSRMSDS